MPDTNFTPGQTLLLIDHEDFEFREYASSEADGIQEGDLVVLERSTQRVRFGPTLSSFRFVEPIELKGVSNRKVELIELTYDIEGGDTCQVKTASGQRVHLPHYCLEVPAPNYTRAQMVEMLETKEKAIRNTDNFWELRHETAEKITNHLKGMEITEWQGHMERGVYFYSPGWYKSAEARIEEMMSLASYSFTKMEAGDLEHLLAVLDSGLLLEEPLVLKSSLSSLDRFECPNCTEKLGMGTDGKSLVVLGEPCPHPDGLITEWELNVPSGKIVVANDLREWFQPESDGHDINKRIGTHLQTLEYAKVGMSHGFVGNTCPGIYRNGEDKFVIGNYQDEIWTGKDYVPNPEPAPWGEEVAGIITDLWWYSIVDLDEMERRFAHYNPDADFQEFLSDSYVHVVDVKPGVYKFVHPQGTNRDAQLVEFATFEWVRDPDPVQDFLGEHMKQEWNASEVVLQSIMNWPTLYRPERDPEQKFENYEDRLSWEEMSEEQRMHALAGASGQIMCTLGNGVDWHEKGFPRGHISEEVVALAAEFGDIPLFEGRRGWYPISEGYGMCLAAGVVNPNNVYTRHNEPVHYAPSFVRLALNILRNMVLYGESPRLNHEVWPPRYQVAASRNRMNLAVRTYRGLRERYPDVEPQDAEFDEWIHSEVVDDYVANYDFGPDHPPKERWGPDPSFKKEGEFVEFNAIGTSSAREGQVSLSRYQSTNAEFGECWYGDGQSTVPARFVARVVGPVMSTNSGPLLEISFDEGAGKGRRLAIKKDQKDLIRQFDGEEEYNRLKKEIQEAREARAKEIAQYKANPDYTFKKMSLSVQRDTPKALNEEGELTQTDLIVKLQFKGASSNGPNPGYGYYDTEALDQDHPVFGGRISELVPVGWKLNKRSVWLVVRVGDQHYAKNFKLNAKTGFMGLKGAWKPVDADRAKSLSPNPFARA